MKKLFCAILAVMMLLSLTACGKKDDNAQGGKVATNLNLAEIYQTMTSGVQMPGMMQLDSDMMLDLCGIQKSYYTQAVVYICENELRADEIWMLEATDADALAQLKTLAQNRLNQKDAESATYDPQQNAIVKAAQVIESGNYLIVIVSPDAEAIAAAFRTAAGI